MSRAAHDRLFPRIRLLNTGLLAITLLSLTACGTVRESRANPFNWFGNDTIIVRTDALEDGANSGEVSEINPLIPQRRASIFRSDEEQTYGGALVSRVTDLNVDRVPGGAVIRATGVVSSLGAFDVRLVEVPTAEANVLRFEMRAYQPRESAGQGSDAARTVNVATSVTDQGLAGVRSIEVIARENQSVTRR